MPEANALISKTGLNENSAFKAFIVDIFVNHSIEVNQDAKSCLLLERFMTLLIQLDAHNTEISAAELSEAYQLNEEDPQHAAVFEGLTSSHEYLLRFCLM